MPSRPIPTQFDNRNVVELRGPKATLNEMEPYEFLVEKELLSDSQTGDSITVFLTNRECGFKCVMCDLWKNTLDESVNRGSIPFQIRQVLEKSTAAKQIKLYNSGSFFDSKSIPAEDHAEIASLCDPFENVVVENHPKLVDERVLGFRDRLKGKLEVAMGLETANEAVLARLNKQMTADDFKRAAGFLRECDIAVRTFVLLNPPFMSSGEDGIEWAIKSIEFAVEAGSGCVAVIPTRAGNGAMEVIEKEGLYTKPEIRSIERVMDAVLPIEEVRVFSDLWEMRKFAKCEACADQRISRLERMNFTQMPSEKIGCGECGGE